MPTDDISELISECDYIYDYLVRISFGVSDDFSMAWSLLMRLKAVKQSNKRLYIIYKYLIYYKAMRMPIRPAKVKNLILAEIRNCLSIPKRIY